MKKEGKGFWNWLWKSDSLLSLIVLLILAYIIIRFIFFPLLGFITSSPQSLLIVESCSMNHPGILSFENWWELRGDWYVEKGFTKEQLESYSYRFGMKMGDIVLLWNRGEIEIGDVIVFDAGQNHPIIHRVISLDPLQTKGDYNTGQLPAEKNIPKENVMGKAVFRIPKLGWGKLVFVKIYEKATGVKQPEWC